ncbi:YceK/YidQ family lipoprotein [Pseudomonas sp. GD04058]|uniref:YceK/YidQ family lipoprotein n=1 Tax=Pseudomonas sp. GD04058 TaxID=2975429 RepID=UPI00244D3933|nr:YceK/YidQ family lipoprotein [Pseudomonas sp. GD04058]MDG9884620.1 YceK/YidQ family lipoprotein [Pseudomonas sp. GD04058]
MRALVFALLVVLCATGCATVRTLDAAKPGAPLVYSGTRLDLYAMQGGCCAADRFGAEAPKYPGLDLPGSMVLDTVLLPLSVLTVLGVGLQASGGL